MKLGCNPFSGAAVLLCLQPVMSYGQADDFESSPPYAQVEAASTSLSTQRRQVDIQVTNTGDGQFDWARLTLKANDLPATDWWITASSVTGTRLQRFRAADFLQRDGVYTVDSKVYSLPVIRLELDGPGPDVGYLVVRGRAVAGVETTIGNRNLIPIDNFDPSTRNSARAIVLVEYSKNDSVHRCNGVILSRRLAITNAHCIADKSVLQESPRPRIYLDYQSQAQLGTEVPITDILDSDQKLDLTFLKLADSVDLNAVEPIALSKDDAPVGTKLRIVQHYRKHGWRKMVSQDDDCILKEQRVSGRAQSIDFDFTHGCDTHKGSSGTAVFLRNQFVFVGLHHWGRKPGVWNCNKAVRISKMEDRISLLQQQFPSIYQEIRFLDVNSQDFEQADPGDPDCG